MSPIPYGLMTLPFRRSTVTFASFLLDGLSLLSAVGPRKYLCTEGEYADTTKGAP
jgi:hypothetical protein